MVPEAIINQQEPRNNKNITVLNLQQKYMHRRDPTNDEHNVVNFHKTSMVTCHLKEWAASLATATAEESLFDSMDDGSQRW